MGSCSQNSVRSEGQDRTLGCTETPNVAMEWVALLLCFAGVLGSYLGPETSCPDWCVSWLPVVPSGKLIPHIKPRRLRSTCFKIKLSLSLRNYAQRLEDVWGSEGIAPRVLNIRTRWKWVVRITPQPYSPKERVAGWYFHTVLPLMEMEPRFLDRPVCSHLLYGLSYPSFPGVLPFDATGLKPELPTRIHVAELPRSLWRHIVDTFLERLGSQPVIRQKRDLVTATLTSSVTHMQYSWKGRSGSVWGDENWKYFDPACIGNWIELAHNFVEMVHIHPKDRSVTTV
jgi:hypothetical protein